MKKKIRFRLLSNRLLTAPFMIQIFALFLFALTLILSAALILTFWGFNFGEATWWAFIRLSDFGILDRADLYYMRSIGAVLAILGWVIFGLFISIAATSVQQRVQNLKKGISGVNLKGHTIVFGWNQTIYALVLDATSTKNDNGSGLVIMTERTAEEMAHDIITFCGAKALREVILRYGNPESVEDQKRINAGYAEKIIILHDLKKKTPFESDAFVLKTTMALGKNIKQCKANHLKRKIILDVLQPTSISLMKGLLSDIKSNSELCVIPLLTQKVIGRVIAQCALQPGLSEIYSDLFSYKEIKENHGNFEIYSITLKELGIHNPIIFEDLLGLYPDTIFIGYISEGSIGAVINPPWGSLEAQYQINPAVDRLLLIADDIRSIGRINDKLFKENISLPVTPSTKMFEPKKVLVYGSGFKAFIVIQELLAYLPLGSEITCTRQLNSKLENIATKGASGINLNFMEMDEIEALLSTTSLNKIISFDVIIMARDSHRNQDHDTFSLMLLSGLNACCSSLQSRPRIVMELLDSNNAELARSSNADDVIIATELASTFLYNVSCDLDRYALFEELLGNQGSEIYFKPLHCYLKPNDSFSFHYVKAVARRRNEIALGYSFKDEATPQWVFGTYYANTERKVDKIIVLAEDDTL